MADYLIDLDSDETIVREVRKHIFTFLLHVLLLIILLIVPLFPTPSITAFLTEAAERGGTLFAIFYLLWILILWVIFFFKWTNYYLDVWVITNKRVFDIDQKGMFNRTTSVFRLERIEDITVEVHGVLPTLLKYGDVHIHTAGTHDVGSGRGSDITIRGARHPLEVKRIIMNEHGKVISGSSKPRHERRQPSS